MATEQVGGSSNDTVTTISKHESSKQEKDKDSKNNNSIADIRNLSSDTKNTAKANGSKEDSMEERIGNSENNDEFLKILDDISQIANQQDLYERFNANKKVLIDESEGGGGFQGVFDIVIDSELVDCKSNGTARVFTRALLKAYPKNQLNGM